MKKINQNYLSDIAQKIKPYVWDFGGKNELRFNSNTVPFTPKSLNLFLKEMEKNCPINEYADPTYAGLKKLLADYEKVSVENITITNSGDEAIDVLAKTFLNPADLFITTPPTYDVFSIQSEINRGINLSVPLTKPNFTVDAEQIIEKAKNKKVKMIFLCNPNNPTGSIIPAAVIENIITSVNCIVIVDEAYREFYGKTSTQLIKKYENVVILRSLSKFAALAGARIGYLIANKSLSKKFDLIRFPMGISYLSYKLAETVLANDLPWIKKQIQEIKKERARMTKALTNFGFLVYPSETNFILVNMGGKAKEIYLKLKAKNLYIRDRSSKKYLESCARITIRSKEENNLLLAALREIVTKEKYAFIDRDGTLIFEPQDTFQIDSLDKLKILDGVITGLRLLKKQGYKLILVSNQDGIGTPAFPKEDFEIPQNKMLEIFKKEGIIFDKIFICPHLESDNCLCRKPKIGILKNFDLKNIDINKSFMCGDRKTDGQFAKNLGIKFVPMKLNSNFYEALKKEEII